MSVTSGLGSVYGSLGIHGLSVGIDMLIDSSMATKIIAGI